MNQSYCDLLNQLGSYGNYIQFSIFFWQGKTGKYISESSRLKLSEKFSSHQFVLLDENNLAFTTLNRGGRVNLPFLRIILAVHQKSPEPSFNH